MTVVFTTNNLLLPAKLNALPKGIVARGRRITSSSTTTSATGIGVLRLDGVGVTSGRGYHIYTSDITLIGTATSAVVRAFLTHTTDGSSAGTGSTVLGAGIRDIITNTGGGAQPIRPMSEMFYAGATGSLSVLLIVALASGTGTASLFGSGTSPIDLVIADEGIDPGNTGVSI